MATRTKIRRNPNARITTGFYSERNQAARARRRALPPGFGGPPKADGNASAEDGGEVDQDDVKMVKQPERPNLPFSQSYVGLLPPPTGPHKRPPRKSWPTPAVPITWPNDPNIPEDWTCEELDLDPDDLDAQLVRVDERIANQILPDMFEQRKQQLLELKAERDNMIARESGSPGLSMDVIRRLDYLIEMGEQLVNTPDPCGVIPNIEAIINAYRKRQLEWNEGLVTYWSKGKQICEPRPFHYGEFLDVNKQYDGHTDFWVEGLFPSRPASQLIFQAQEFSAPPGSWHNDMYITMRLPNNRTTQMQYLFVDDSGAETSLIYDQDIVHLQKTPAGTISEMPPLMGVILAKGMQGGQGTPHELRAMEVNMLADTSGDFMTLWDWIPVALHTILPKRKPPPRLSGPWHRYKFYTGSAPDGTGRTWAFNQKQGWNTLVPTVTNVMIAPRPHYSAWGGVPAAVNASAGAPVSARPAKAPPPRVLVAPNPAGRRPAPLNQAALINVPPVAGLAPAVIAAKTAKAAPKAAPKVGPGLPLLFKVPPPAPGAGPGGGP